MVVMIPYKRIQMNRSTLKRRLHSLISLWRKKKMLGQITHTNLSRFVSRRALLKLMQRIVHQFNRHKSLFTLSYPKKSNGKTCQTWKNNLETFFKVPKTISTKRCLQLQRVCNNNCSKPFTKLFQKLIKRSGNLNMRSLSVYKE